MNRLLVTVALLLPALFGLALLLVGLFTWTGGALDEAHPTAVGLGMTVAGLAWLLWPAAALATVIRGRRADRAATHVLSKAGD